MINLFLVARVRTQSVNIYRVSVIGSFKIDSNFPLIKIQLTTYAVRQQLRRTDTKTTHDRPHIVFRDIRTINWDKKICVRRKLYLRDYTMFVDLDGIWTYEQCSLIPFISSNLNLSIWTFCYYFCLWRQEMIVNDEWMNGKKKTRICGITTIRCRTRYSVTQLHNLVAAASMTASLAV